MRVTIFKPEYLNSYALIIGINNYLYASKLDYAAKDAESLSVILQDKFCFPKENINLILDKKASKDKIMQAILRYSKEDIKPDDRLLIFFAGHGYTIEGRRGEIGYLVPVNGNVDDLSTLIPWYDLTKSSEIIPAKHIFFIIDACYGGLVLTRALKPGSMRFLKSMLQKYTRQVLTAGKADEVVSDSGGPLPEHSIFTGHLLQALEGNAATKENIITASSVMSYVYEKVSRDSNSQQTPHYGFLEGDGDFIFNLSLIESIKTKTKEDLDILIEVESSISNSNSFTDMELIDKVKEYIGDDKFKIKLEDNVNQEIRRVLTTLNEKNFPLNEDVNIDSLTQRLEKYFSIFKYIQEIIIAISYWGEQNHIALSKKIISRITEKEKISNGKVFWLKLQWFPSLLLIYSGGISAIAADNYYNLAALFNTKIQSLDNEDNLEFIYLLGPVLSDFEQLEIFKMLPGHEKYYVPRSEYLYKRLQPILDDLLFLGNSYETLFDRFEVFLALVHAYNRMKKGHRIWGPIGRFGWKYKRNGENNILREIFNEANSKKENWEPLKAGLFGGSFENFTQIFLEYEKLISNLFWY